MSPLLFFGIKHGGMNAKYRSTLHLLWIRSFSNFLLGLVNEIYVQRKSTILMQYEFQNALKLFVLRKNNKTNSI